LGHIISKDWIYVEPKHTKATMQIPLPHSKNHMQTFFWKINVVWRFVRDFFKTVISIQLIIKKDVQFKWIFFEKESFKKIKDSIETTPTFKSP
jgi:hypothetical protein